MKKLHFTILTLCALAANVVHAQSSEVIRAYIIKYKDLAIEEMQRTGVPAAITLAQGIHETAAGTSNLVLSSNNHFGIKCKTEWAGPAVYHDDDAKGECFRKYDDPSQSYRDHSDFLKNRPFYASLFSLEPTDYEGWAYGLKKAGYATNPKYPQILIKIIRDYNLQDYTFIALSGKKDANTAEWASNSIKTNPSTSVLGTVAQKQKYPSGVFTINDVKVIFVEEGTSFLKIAEEHSVSLSRLFEYNEIPQQDIAIEDQLIYLQRKRRTGATKYHVVKSGETLHDIAQAEGVQQQSLIEFNSLPDDLELRAGDKLNLNSKDFQFPKPKVVLAKASKAIESILNNGSVAEVKSENDFVVHVVQPKETMYGIAKKYDVGVEEVMKWNDVQSKDLKVGQQLRINKRAGNAIN